jgi:hypothetical protein
MLASHCIVFNFLFLHSFFSLHTSCSRCCQLFIAFSHFGVLVFLFFSVHFSQQLMLTFLCILSILLFLISFSLVHTSCIFLLSTLHCIHFDNQLLCFTSYTSILVYFNFAHCYENLLSFNLFSFFPHSYLILIPLLFVVWLCMFFSVHLGDGFFLCFFNSPLVLGHHCISYITIVLVFFIAPIFILSFSPGLHFHLFFRFLSSFLKFYYCFMCASIFFLMFLFLFFAL